MIRKIIFAIFFIGGFYHPVWSQLNNQAFYNTRKIEPEYLNKLYLSTDVLLFTKNNEYFNKIADGYTLYGFQFNPFLTYHPSDNIRVDAGFYTQKDFGNPDFSEVSPYLTVIFKWGPLKQIFGNIDGSMNHGLIEPLYDFERGLIDRQETGLQSLIENDRMFLDLWVDWETMIYKGDNDQEEVSGGISFKYNLKSGAHEFAFPLQLILYHRGGQIDSSPAPIATLQNSAVGLSYKYHFSEGSFLQTLRSENFYVYYKDWSPQENQLAFDDGDGYYVNLAIGTAIDLEFMLSYWVGNEFITIRGGQLYPSVSSTYKFPDYVEQRREIIIYRLMHDLHLTDELTWSSRIEPFYNIGTDKWEFSFGFYLNFSSDFFIKDFQNGSD